MHEASLIRDLVRKAETVVEAARAARATDVVVTQGRLGHASPAHLRAHFEIASTGTRLEGARLHVRTGGDDADLRLSSVTVEEG